MFSVDEHCARLAKASWSVSPQNPEVARLFAEVDCALAGLRMLRVKLARDCYPKQ